MTDTKEEELGSFVVTEVYIEGVMGPQGEKGEPFTYEDFTEQQLAPFNALKEEAQSAARQATSASTTVQQLTDDVLAIKSDVVKVSENRISITAVSEVIDQVNSVASVVPDLDTVIINVEPIKTVADNTEHITSVHSNINNVNAVADNIPALTTVSGLEEQINTINANKSALEALYKTLNMSVTATTLAEGAEATVTQTATENGFVVNFGIPRGTTGTVDTTRSYTFSQPIQFNGGTSDVTSYSIFSKYRMQIGDNTTNIHTGILTWRNCGSIYGVVGGDFYVNSDGTIRVTHKSGYNSSADDAVLSFDSTGLYFAASTDASGVGAELGDRVLTLSSQVKGETTPSAWTHQLNSGLVQQGGYIDISDVGEKITFPIQFTHIPSVQVTYVDPENSAPSWIKSIDATGFTPATSSTTATGLVWSAIGNV